MSNIVRTKNKFLHRKTDVAWNISYLQKERVKLLNEIDSKQRIINRIEKRLVFLESKL